MKKTMIAIAACGMIMMSSCTTVKKSATTVDVVNGIYQYPTVADVDVLDKVQSEMVWSFRPFHIGEPSESTAKGNLISDVLKQADADILLEPNFSFTKTSYGERSLVVTGFPAKYKNFRKASESDLNAIKACNTPTERKVFNGDGGGLLGIIKK